MKTGAVIIQNRSIDASADKVTIRLFGLTLSLPRFIFLFKQHRHSSETNRMAVRLRGKMPQLTGNIGFNAPTEVLKVRLHEIKKALRELNNDAYISKRKKRRIAAKLLKQVNALIAKENSIYSAGFDVKKV